MASWEAWGIPLIVIGLRERIFAKIKAMPDFSEYAKTPDVKQWFHKKALLVISIILWRKWLRGPMYRGKERMDGKVVAITGANTGIGFETAKDIVKRGAKVIILCRNTKKGQDAIDKIKAESGVTCDMYELDLSSLDSVRKCAAQLKKNEPKIHVLINNAGIMMCPEWQTIDGFEMQFGTNHLGHFLLTMLLLDNIKAAAPSRIVNLSSLAHKLFSGMHFNNIHLKNEYSPRKAYGQSKLANILFTKALAKRVSEDKVNVYAVHPGVVNTELTRHIVGTSSFIVYMLNKTYGAFVKTPVLGAQSSIYCAVNEEAGNETGKYYNDCREERPSSRARNADDAERLWDISVEMVKLYK